ncbi:MAG: TRAP transporter small permease subunit [Pseudorhodoplanes sp.]|jgi:TRAP-type C4-dicarboxylate transport system permease small subunit|nr:TRAP transporter small permease subunit [Pseudorhodoplanes sp.]
MTTERQIETASAGGLVGRLGDAVCRICLVIAALSLLAIVVINVANVTGRYVFGSPFTWAEELMLFLMILIVFTAAPVAAWRNQHIRIEAFIDHASSAIRWGLLAIGAIVSVVILTLVAAAGYQIVAMLYLFDQRSDALHMPMWIPQAFLVFGLALTAVMFGAAVLSGRTR